MINSKSGLWHRNNQAVRFSDANDLVQRTLARHGLASPMSGGQFSSKPQAANPMAGFSHTQTSAAQTIPDGAAFVEKRFECSAGSRDYMVYIPSTAASGAAGLIMMLHGCTQNAKDFAAGTGMNDLAERDGFIVVYPQQSRGDNAQSCWNWFSRGDQKRGRGEPAILAELATHLATDHQVADNKVFVAGLSAGAAMAVVLGETYPDVFAAVGAHSGLPFGAAKDVASAFAAMGGKPLTPSANMTGNHTVRTIVFHGLADHTVHPTNGAMIAERAALRLEGVLHDASKVDVIHGRATTRRTQTNTSNTVQIESWTVEGLGHAWSGGNRAGTYTDPHGPDASGEMVRFFFEHPEAK